MTISCWILLKRRNVLDNICKENKKIKKHVLCSITFPRKSCRLWNKVEKRCRAGETTDGNIAGCMRCAGWTIKATHTHWEYVILNAFPRKRGLHERASMLRYTYSAVLLRSISSTTAVLLALFHSQIQQRRISWPTVNMSWEWLLHPDESPGAAFPDKIFALNCGIYKENLWNTAENFQASIEMS